MLNYIFELDVYVLRIYVNKLSSGQPKFVGTILPYIKIKCSFPKKRLLTGRFDELNYTVQYSFWFNKIILQSK